MQEHRVLYEKKVVNIFSHNPTDLIILNSFTAILCYLKLQSRVPDVSAVEVLGYGKTSDSLCVFAALCIGFKCNFQR